MVRATNAGGEAQSIADVAVFEPKPDTMVEVHKTVIYENVQDKNILQVICHFFDDYFTSLYYMPNLLFESCSIHYVFRNLYFM